MIYKILFPAAFMLFSVSAHAEADDKVLQRGQKLHEENCTQCHGSEVYTRDDRFIKSLEALRKQVKRCEINQDITWFEEDSEAVVKFLNNKYYKF